MAMITKNLKVNFKKISNVIRAYYHALPIMKCMGVLVSSEVFPPVAKMWFKRSVKNSPARGSSGRKAGFSSPIGSLIESFWSKLLLEISYEAGEGCASSSLALMVVWILW